MPNSNTTYSEEPDIPIDESISRHLGCVLIILFMIGGTIAILIPVIQAAHERAHRNDCPNRIKQLALGLHSYNDHFGQFPPAYTVDESGNKLHSWRTLILPFLEHQDFYDKLRLEEPWNSPHNLAIFKEIEPLYRSDEEGEPYFCYRSPKCPSVVDKDYTNYAMIIGPNCPSDGPNGFRFKDLPNGASHSILLVETTSPILWYEPKDIDIETLYNKPSANEPVIGSFSEGLFFAAFCDSSVHPLSMNLKEDVLQALAEGRTKSKNALLTH